MDRSKIIGGSDIAAILGVSRWKTPLSLWAEKTGKIQTELSNFEAAEIGTELEEYVANKFSKKTGIKLRRDAREFKHPLYPYMVAHIDRWVVGEDSGFEAKTASAWKAKEWIGEEIPEEYICQCIWYSGIVGKKKWYIAVLIGGQKFLWKEVQFDQELFDQMVCKAKEFWEEFVCKNVPPLATYGDNDTLMMMFPSSTEKSIQFEDALAHELDNLVEYRDQLKEKIKAFQNCIEEVEPKIKQFLGEAELGETERYKISWKTQEKKEYTVKASSTRVLRITEKKEQE